MFTYYLFAFLTLQGQGQLVVPFNGNSWNEALARCDTARSRFLNLQWDDPGFPGFSGPRPLAFCTAAGEGVSLSPGNLGEATDQDNPFAPLAFPEPTSDPVFNNGRDG